MSDRVPFVGGSYPLRRKKADVQRSVNLMPTLMETPGGKPQLYLSQLDIQNGKTGYFLKPIPGLGVFSYPPSTPGDQYWSNVIALWHFDQNMIDSAGTFPPGNVGSCTLPTSNVLFAPTAPYTPASATSTGVVLSGPSSAYTIEWSFIAPPTTCAPFRESNNVFQFGWSWTGGTNGTIGYTERDPVTSSVVLSLVTPSLSLVGVLHRFAVVRQTSGLVTLYVDGTAVVQGSDIQQNMLLFVVQWFQSLASPQSSSIDEVRITAGIARYTGSTYTVSTSPFPNHG